jgi:hypothetical protein
LETRLRSVPGVGAVEANPWTLNVLLVFDPAVTDGDALLVAVRSVKPGPAPPRKKVPASEAKPRSEKQDLISVRGLDRDPRLARRIVQHLRHAHGIRALAKPLTSHVLVHYDEKRVFFEELIASVAHLDLPALPGEDAPLHPLDPLPLRQAVTRAVGALLGLGVVTYRRLGAAGTAPGTGGIAGWTAGVINLLQGLPPVRDRLNQWFGKKAADFIVNGFGIIALTIADYPLGLIVTGVEALIMIGEVTARRSAWRRYEENLAGATSAEAGAMIRLEAGMRVPTTAQVIEGTGTATAASGLPVPLAPGATAPAGAELSGGPFVMELQGGEPFTPQPRPTPPAPTLYDRYHQVGGPLSLAFAALAAFRTLSPARTFETMLLLNPRTAVIGLEVANLAAASRLLRAGLTVVGSRPSRTIQLPNVVLLREPRLVTDGLEVAVLLALEDPSAAPAVLALAAGISTAAGSPWGKVFSSTHIEYATGGTFNGLWATAIVDGVQYYLGPPEDPPPLLEAYRSSHRGGYMLELRRFEEERAVGYVALRPRLRAGVDLLVEACQELDVSLELLPGGAPEAAQAVAWRAGATLNPSVDAVATIREKQRSGAVVALVSDSAEAAAAFAACDLAIGLADGYGGDFPARTDLLAPDLKAIVDLLETAARRELAVRDGVGLSIASNAVGAAVSLFGGPVGARRASWGVYLSALATMGTVLYRLRGGLRPESILGYLVDPRPERWARRKVADVLRAFNTREDGLTSREADARKVPTVVATSRDQLLTAIRNQLRTPIISILAGGACLTIVLGQPLNTALLGLTISINVAAGVWQEREVGKAADELRRLTASAARVVRDGRPQTIAASEVVPGDILLLAPGDRLPADARLLPAARRRPLAEHFRPGGGRGRIDRRVAAGRQGAPGNQRGEPHCPGRERRGGRDGAGGRGGRRPPHPPGVNRRGPERGSR